MTEQMLSPGDVLGFPIERIGRFGACQIVAAVLNWQSWGATQDANRCRSRRYRRPIS